MRSHQHEVFVEKRHAIIGSSTRLFGSIGFDATPTLEIADEADVMVPLIYRRFKGKHELFKIGLDSAFGPQFLLI